MNSSRTDRRAEIWCGPVGTVDMQPSTALRTLFDSPEVFDNAKREARRIVHQLVEATLNERLAARTLSGFNPAAPADEVVSELAKRLLALDQRTNSMHEEACSRIRQVELRGLHMFEYHVQPLARTTSKLERQVADLLKSAELMHKTINEQTAVINKQSECIAQLKQAMNETSNTIEFLDTRIGVTDFNTRRNTASIATINNQRQFIEWTAEVMEANEDNAYPPVVEAVYEPDVLQPLPSLSNSNIANLPR